PKLAHELRNPLFSISATVEAMAAHVEPERADEIGRYLCEIQAAVDRLARVAADLMELGRPIAIAPEPRPLEPLLWPAVATCAPAAEAASVTLTSRFEVPLARVRAGGTSLPQALAKLLENAIQHAPRESAVELAAENVVDAAGRAWVQVTV